MKLILFPCGLEQWLARLAHNQKVPGSNPGAATIFQLKVARDRLSARHRSRGVAPIAGVLIIFWLRDSSAIGVYDFQAGSTVSRTAPVLGLITTVAGV